MKETRVMCLWNRYHLVVRIEIVNHSTVLLYASTLKRLPCVDPHEFHPGHLFLFNSALLHAFMRLKHPQVTLKSISNNRCLWKSDRVLAKIHT